MSSPRKIDPQVKTVSEIFDNNVYQFDYYQRNYSWGQQQIKDLIDDLWEAYQKNPDEEYYLSNILLAPRGGAGHQAGVYSVVDGQQRLTSLCLLLAVGYRIAYKAVGKGVHSSLKGYQFFYVDLLRRIRKEDEITYKLQHNDFEYLMSILLESDAKIIDSKTTKDQMHSISPTIGNMYDRFIDIYDVLAEKANSSYSEDLAKSDFNLFESEHNEVVLGEENEMAKVLGFFRWILNNVAFIAVYADGLDRAYNIFTTQNDRGLPLTSADLLKSNLLTHISDAARPKAADIWNTMYKDLLFAMGPKGIHEFFRDYLRAKYALAAVGDRAYDQMADPGGYHRWLIENRELMKLTDANSIKEFVSKELPFFANIYIFMNQKTKDKEYDPSFSSLYFLSKLGYPSGFQAMLAISAISLEDSESDWKEKIRILTKTLETYVVRRLWSELNWKQNFIKKDVIELAKLFRKKKDLEYIEAVCNDLLLSDYSNIDRTMLKLSNTFKNSVSPFGHEPFSIEPIIKSSNLKFFRLLLARITHFVEKNATPNNYVDLNRYALPKDFELEHVLPKDYESYAETYLEEAEYDYERNRIGAMLVIPKINNNSYQDKLIEDKLEDYLRNDPYLAKILNPRFDELGPGNGIQKWVGFVAKYGLEANIRPILGNVMTPEDIDRRTDLYRRLSTIVWSNSYDASYEGNKDGSGDQILDKYQDQIISKGWIVVTTNGDSDDSDDSPGEIKLKRSRVVSHPMTQYSTSVEELIKAGYLLKGEKLVSLAAKYPGEAVINEDGQILFDGNIYSSLSTSAIECKQGHNSSVKTENGWVFWSVMRDGELISVKQIRDNYINRTPKPGLQGFQDITVDKKEVVSYMDLIKAGLLIEGSTLYSLYRDKKIYIRDSTLVSEYGTLFNSLKEAAKFMEHGDANSDKYMNGWKYWHYLRDNTLVPLSKLRDELLA